MKYNRGIEDSTSQELHCVRYYYLCIHCVIIVSLFKKLKETALKEGNHGYSNYAALPEMMITAGYSGVLKGPLRWNSLCKLHGIKE